MTVILKAEHVTKYYKERGTCNKALDDVSVEIKQGKSMALIGESGSGKTTFGKAIAGFEKITTGKISWKGQEIQQLNEKKFRHYRQEMQMIFQSSKSAFDPSYTVGESIREVMKNYRKLSNQQCDEEICELFCKVGLKPELMERYAGQLSGGQCQRANIARSLILHPQFVICDEPVSSLDFSVRKQILDLLNKLQEEMGITYLLITHDLSNVPYVCQELTILYRGKVVEYMHRTDRIAEMAAHPYTRMLYESIPAVMPENRRIAKCLTDIGIESGMTQGCIYQERCSRCHEKCREEVPDLKEIECGHYAACFYPE